MKTLTLGITPGRLDPTTSFAYVDYAEKPQGGYNAIERTICGTTDRAAFDKMIASLSVAPDRIGDDLAEDRVLCTTRGERDYCDVPAREEGDATMTFVISNAHGAPHLVGFGQRSTFMITDEARLARDQARQLEAFEAKLAPACSR
jgi:hypothetical protein